MPGELNKLCKNTVVRDLKCLYYPTTAWQHLRTNPVCMAASGWPLHSRNIQLHCCLYCSCMCRLVPPRTNGEYGSISQRTTSAGEPARFAASMKYATHLACRRCAWPYMTTLSRFWLASRPLHGTERKWLRAQQWWCMAPIWVLHNGVMPSWPTGVDKL